MTRVAALLAALVLTTVLAGCDGDHDFVPGSDPGPSKTKVDTPDLRTLKKQAGIAPCRPGPGGGRLPDVTLPCLGGGRSVDMSSLRGPMLINVWQSACDECHVEMPVLEQFHETYADQVPIIGLDFVDQFPGSALELAEDGGVTYPLLADPGGDLMDERGWPRIPGYPVTIFLDADGAVAYSQIGVISSLDQLRDLVRDHLEVDL
jgi:thiol-disulfide isomerase/thioredoxin